MVEPVSGILESAYVAPSGLLARNRAVQGGPGVQGAPPAPALLADAGGDVVTISGAAVALFQQSLPGQRGASVRQGTTGEAGETTPSGGDTDADGEAGEAALAGAGQGATGQTGGTQARAATGTSQEATGGSSAAQGSGTAGGAGQLTQQQQAEVAQLKRIDAAVHAHEQAHQAAGGGLAGAASYSYTTGPDGKRYAMAGEVSIDVSTVPNDPRATIQKMETVKRAALAPADPSAQDRAVASQAGRAEIDAQAELRAQQTAQVQAASGGAGKSNGETATSGARKTQTAA